MLNYTNVKSQTLELEGRMGSTVDLAVKECINVSKMLQNIPVVLIYNEIRVHIDKNTTEEQALDNYYLSIAQRASQFI